MTLQLQARPYDDPDVLAMVAEVQEEYVARYGGPDATAVDAAEFAPPEGLFLLGRLDDEPVVTGGWRWLDGTQAEIKRMYVRAAFRRRGLAQLMLAELERTAAAAGVQHLVLTTGPQQPEAIALYWASGYTPVPPFGHYADHDRAMFLGRQL